MSEKIIYNFSNEPTGTHMLLLDEVKYGSKVLDVGCAGGYLGEYLINQKRCEVWGIEPNNQDAGIAKTKNYKIVISKKIEEAISGIEFLDQSFDFILLADVLEHLSKPEELLSEIKKKLKPEGKILISLPNIAHYSIRINLLLGRWDMKDVGIMDKMHLHFYTLKTAKDLIKDAGLNIEKIRPRGDLERWFRMLGAERFGKIILNLWQEFFAIQFIFVTKLK